MSGPAARRNDPWTSWAAAHSIPSTHPSHQAVVWLARTFREGFTLEQIVAAARRECTPFSDSRIRSAVAELMDEKKCDRVLIEDTGKTRPTTSGRAARVLRLTFPTRLAADAVTGADIVAGAITATEIASATLL